MRITLKETLVGFGIALVLGIGLGTLLGRVPWLEQAMRPVIVASQVVPKVALIPLFIIWFGFGITSKIIIVAMLAFFPILLNMILGVRSVDSGQRDVMRSLNASRWQTFRRLEYPSTLPYILAGMEVGIMFAVIGAIVGEYLGGDQGLGYRIVTSLNNLEAEPLFAVIFVLTLFGFLLYLAVVVLKRFLIPWHASAIDSTRPVHETGGDTMVMLTGDIGESAPRGAPSSRAAAGALAAVSGAACCWPPAAAPPRRGRGHEGRGLGHGAGRQHPAAAAGLRGGVHRRHGRLLQEGGPDRQGQHRARLGAGDPGHPERHGAALVGRLARVVIAIANRGAPIQASRSPDGVRRWRWCPTRATR